GDGNPSALVDEGACGGEPDSAIAAGDQGGLAVESHGLLLLVACWSWPRWGMNCIMQVLWIDRRPRSAGWVGPTAMDFWECGFSPEPNVSRSRFLGRIC